MEQFFEELEELLKKYNATILRSSNDKHNLVCSVDGKFVGNAFPKFRDFQFDEEITANDLHFGRYHEITEEVRK